MIVRGTTPTLVFETDLQNAAREIKNCQLIMKSEEVTIIKNKSDMEFKDNLIMCTLSSIETETFKQNGEGKIRVPKPEPVFIQLKVTLNNGTVCASRILKSTINAILEE
ncbi:hypothetical protein [Fusobacterium sp.]|uniref:hypothetical protein n=1 Tax=Fusobacterium sp. TaxID=68766 RepID=UPI000E80E3FE|nr:hypothetical protein [Fusobacterium sp.]HBJ80173.1 hypothetical protein [Fusobacterium sp.]